MLNTDKPVRLATTAASAVGSDGQSGAGVVDIAEHAHGVRLLVVAVGVRWLAGLAGSGRCGGCAVRGEHLA
jgi:hypothetical protein